MAASSAASRLADRSRLVSCGNCLEVEGYIHNPKLLPCSHSFCETCLKSNLKNADVIKCKVCDEKYKVAVEDLPSALEDVHPSPFCEPCERNGKLKMTAGTYCVNCERKLCAAHQKLHIELNWNHVTHTIMEYLISEITLDDQKQKFCELHKDQPVCLGCAKCWMVYCPDCLSSIGTCGDSSGSNHKLMSMKELSTAMKESLKPQRKEAEELFDKWSAVIKEATITLSNWDTETEHGVRLIDDTEQKQVAELRGKYAALKEKYVTNRGSTKHKLTEYIEKDAGVKLTEFHNQLKAFRADLSKQHVVGLVKQKRELEKRVVEMTDGGLIQPLIVEDQQTVEVLDESSVEIKATLLPQKDLEVGYELATRRHKLPSSMQFISRLPGSHVNPYTACRYKGVTYVGLGNGTINKVDNLGNNTANFIKLSSVVITIRGHMDRLFILEYGQPYKIHVHDLNGGLVKSWNHTDTSGAFYGNKLFLSTNEVVAADVPNQQIVLYDLNGTLKRSIRCPTMLKTHTSMCSAGEECVIITSYNPAQASKINIKTGALLWTKALTYHPYSSTCVGKTVLVGLNGYPQSNGIWIDVINTENGEKITEFNDRTGAQTQVFDLYAENDLLFVSSLHENSVSCYELKY